MGNNPTKKQLEKLCKPTGLYPNIKWDPHIVKKLVTKSLISPLYPPQTEKKDINHEECPICFYLYPTINYTSCCNHKICSECFLQITPSKPTAENLCPFCQKPFFQVGFLGNRSREEIEQEDQEIKHNNELSLESQKKEQEEFNKHREDIWKKIKKDEQEIKQFEATITNLNNVTKLPNNDQDQINIFKQTENEQYQPFEDITEFQDINFDQNQDQNQTQDLPEIIELVSYQK
ncbi:protein sip5 [Anaeramoeba ignava]|uniref:Protein sip5 n=1 Tax=Anaeramoeba ignava TaxID=1746090 RepID=A0A9Q0RAN3_ANAIG|nr:protein sip5 [Anaeramoeba ignava]